MNHFLPREKLKRLGADALSDAELLAIFLRTGSRGVPVMKLAQQMLQELGSLYNIVNASAEDFKGIKGAGEIKLIQLRAVAELAKRFFASQLTRENTLDSPLATRQYLQTLLAEQEREIFIVMFLDNQHRVITARQMFSGSINSVEVHPREIVREALKINAAALIIAHNHPSGRAEPSQADRDITVKICEACRLVNIRVLDHLVIGRGESVSFTERGWL
ncbi:RadC family protein [Pantoea ananatis]|uniref:RadC family protein n=1 Tax=Pantoea ananas TaxID=553 RepID=UPI00092E2775